MTFVKRSIENGADVSDQNENMFNYFKSWESFTWEK